MADYALTFARSARKDLESLDSAIVKRIFPRVEALAREPRPRGCRKIRAERNLWRIRIGDYRVIYAVYDDRQVVDISAVRHRSTAYR